MIGDLPLSYLDSNLAQHQHLIDLVELAASIDTLNLGLLYYKRSLGYYYNKLTLILDIFLAVINIAGINTDFLKIFIGNLQSLFGNHSSTF